MTLSIFLREYQQDIINEWVSFARTLEPAAEHLSDAELRDHAAGMLRVISQDIETRQSPEQQQVKSRGHASPRDASRSAAVIHGEQRYAQGLSLTQLSAEFRALRATVLRLWLPKVDQLSASTIHEMVRFNEAIDQALAESINSYSKRTGLTHDMFLAVLEHDLRVPLAGLDMAGTSLVGGKQPENMAQIGAQVRGNVELMKIMMDDLMEFTKKQLGSGAPLKRNREDVREIAQTALAHAQAAHPDDKFEFQAQGDLTGSFDIVRLRQLFINLLLNARQHGAIHQPIVMNVQGEPDEVIVKVSNHGPVLDKETLKSIFTPLVHMPGGRGAPSRTSMGLGLFLVEEIAISHGGSVEVSSDAVDGTTFTVRLPRHAATDPQ